MLPVPGIDRNAISVRNAWYMLVYAWDLAQYANRWKGDAEKAPNLLGLLARVLVDATEALLRKDLARSFRTTEDEIRGLRGKLHVSDSLRRQSFLKGRSVCSFSELSIDNPRNRLIRSTLSRLGGDARIARAARVEDVRDLRYRIGCVVRDMEGVRIGQIHASDFRRLQLTRNDEPYRLPLAICALIRRLEIPMECEGDAALTALLRDKIKFCNVFERFVRNFYRLTLIDCEVKSETLKWWDDLGCEYVPDMITDISINWRSIDKRVIIDTKYYREYLVSQFGGNPKFQSDHLYQLYAYLRTQEHLGGRYREAAGILLYPSSPDFSAQMKVQGHRLRIETIDLGAEWPAIEARLRDIVLREHWRRAPTPGLASDRVPAHV